MFSFSVFFIAKNLLLEQKFSEINILDSMDFSLNDTRFEFCYDKVKVSGIENIITQITNSINALNGNYYDSESEMSKLMSGFIDNIQTFATVTLIAKGQGFSISKLNEFIDKIYNVLFEQIKENNCGVPPLNYPEEMSKLKKAIELFNKTISPFENKDLVCNSYSCCLQTHGINIDIDSVHGFSSSLITVPSDVPNSLLMEFFDEDRQYLYTYFFWPHYTTNSSEYVYVEHRYLKSSKREILHISSKYGFSYNLDIDITNGTITYNESIPGKSDFEMLELVVTDLEKACKIVTELIKTKIKC